MFEYADCVGVSVFDANATGLLSCRRHAHTTLYVRRQLSGPFSSVDGSTTGMIRSRYISSYRRSYAGDLRATRMGRLIEDFSQRWHLVCAMRYLCRQIIHQTDERLLIFLVLLCTHLAIMYSMLLGSGLMSLLPSTYPKNTTSLVLMAHFFELNTRPSSLATCISRNMFLSCSALSRPYTTKSSAIPTQPGALAVIRSMACWNMS